MNDSQSIGLREYYTPTSRRAAVITTTISTVYFLYTLGIIDIEHSRGFIFGGAIIKPEFAPVLFYVAMVITFTLWGSRFDYETRYQGQIAQPKTMDIRKNAATQQRSAWRDIDVSSNEKAFEAYLDVNPHRRQYFLRDEAKPDGYKYSVNAELETPHTPQWEELVNRRNEREQRAKAKAEGESKLREAENIERGLRNHAVLSYAIFPFASFIAAMTGEFLTWINVFPLFHK